MRGRSVSLNSESGIAGEGSDGDGVWEGLDIDILRVFNKVEGFEIGCLEFYGIKLCKRRHVDEAATF